jgi:hypothetical protein
MKTKARDLIGDELDWAVSRGLGDDEVMCFSTDWAAAGPVIECEKIAIQFMPGNGASCAWRAQYGSLDDISYGPDPLIAAMRCFVEAYYGDDYPSRP